MNGDQGVIFRDIPIVAYPPFKLRSSLIDKDPVIWVHLIEYYITLFQKLIDIYASRDEKLSVKSQQQLFEFLKTYLGETAEESIKIFSLGSINPDIISNSKILKLYVFEFVKRVNLINLQFNGETIWNFVKVYSKLSVLNDKKKSFPVTLELVRKLVDGSLKSKLNYNSDNISLITTLQKYLENLIGSGKFNKFDLETLSLLLGQYVHNTKENNHKPVIVNNKNNNNRKNFNEKKILPSASYEFSGRFVNGKWFEMLEVLYNKGTGVHSKQVFEIEVISILSLPVAQLSKVITTDLRIDNYLMLIRLYPLLCKIVLSKNYRSLNPGLEQRLPFLSKEGRKLKAAPIFDTSHIQMVSDLFPQLNTLQIKKLLVDCDNNIEVVTNKLLEMSEEKIANLEEYKEIQNPYSSSNKRTVFDGDEISQLKLDDSRVYLGKKNKIVHPTGDLDKTSAADLKKKTLTAALRLLYESDEDEPDDTYLDQEKTFGEAQSAGKKLEIDLENEELEEELEDRSSTVKKIPTNQMDMIEHRLFAVFKKSPELFEKSARKSKNRQLMKQETGWTDEQIEGWYRMLFKSPKRFKLLDEYYNFGGGPNGIGNPNRGTLKPSSYRKSRREEEEEKEEEESNTEDDDKSTTESNKNNRFNNNGNKHEAKIISNVKKGDTDNSKEDGKSNVSEKSSKIKRARDNKNKAKKANHNRKAGHDRKMAQGFS